VFAAVHGLLIAPHPMGRSRVGDVDLDGVHRFRSGERRGQVIGWIVGAAIDQAIAQVTASTFE
jgi:hypothetical protein